MPRSSRQIIADLLGRYEPRIRQAFLEAIDEIRNGVVLETIVGFLERGDVSGAIEALNIEPEAFARVELALLEAYNAGGQATVGTLPRMIDATGRVVIFRWGVRNLPGERALRSYAADLVTGIVEDARGGIRQILAEGLARGGSPNTTAQRLIGETVGNRRVGGSIGLTQRQMETVARIRYSLETGDRQGLRAYLGLKLRDRRYDSAVLKLLDGGSAPDADRIEQITARYADRALSYRGRLIAQHETMAALNRAREDAFNQQVDDGKIAQQDITKTWHHTPREHPRLQHIEMDGKQTPKGQDFVLPDGTRMKYPHDPDAPAYQTLNCLCYAEYEINFAAAGLRKFRERQAA